MSLEVLRTLDNTPLDHPLETSLQIMGDHYSLTELLHPFEGSNFLRLLSEMGPRFHTRQWTKDNDKFIELMGPDVDPTQHGIYQARTIGIQMVDAQLGATDSSTREMTSLGAKDDAFDYFVAHHVLHDMHEGVYEKRRGRTVDTITHEKTTESEAAEFEVQEEMINELYSTEKARLLLGNIDDQANGEGFNSIFWRASELLGYASTGLQALAVSMTAEDLTDSERDKCFNMARNAVGNNMHKLEAARQDIIFADDFLILNEPNFKRICSFAKIHRRELASTYNG